MTMINVLVAVNVAQAISNNNLQDYVFMADSTGLCVSGLSNPNELVTTCNNGDTIVWSVVPISPSDTVSILGFSGAAITETMINPGQYPQGNGAVWGGRVNSTGNAVQYSIELLLNGHQMSFDPFITATNVTKNIR